MTRPLIPGSTCRGEPSGADVDCAVAVGSGMELGADDSATLVPDGEDVGEANADGERGSALCKETSRSDLAQAVIATSIAAQITLRAGERFTNPSPRRRRW